MSAMIIAIIGGIGCYIVINLIKVKLQYNDALDAFGIHGVGGILEPCLQEFFNHIKLIVRCRMVLSIQVILK